MKPAIKQLLLPMLGLAAVVNAAALRVIDPRCEYQRDPIAVDAVQPRLSWVLESSERGQRQTAYQILVASSEAKLGWIDEPEPGIFIYDFGQNAAAIPRLRVRGAAGQRVRLTPAEQRHGMTPRRNDGRGLVNPAGVGQPNYWEYTLRGGDAESWAPWFNYSGETKGPSQFTPPELSAMATFHRCARVVSDTAGVLGRSADRQRYAATAC